MTTADNENLRLDDETLVAYVDGELNPEEQARVERILEADEEARTLVKLLRRSAELSAEAYREAMDTPPPERLVATILGARSDAETTAGSSGKVVSLPSERALRRPPMRLALPIAASIAMLVASFVVMRIISVGPEAIQIAAGPVDAGSALQRLLESMPSGESQRIALTQGASKVDVDVALLATFIDRSERPCREIETLPPAGAGGAMTIAVACRSQDGNWNVEGTVQQAAGDAVDQGFKPASGEELPELKALLQNLGAGPALTAADEGGLIARGWK